MGKNLLKQVVTKSSKELTLRHSKPSDAKELIEYLNIIGGESDNMTFGKGEFKLSVDQEETYLKALDEDNISIMIVVTESNKIIAQGSIVSDKRKRLSHNSILGISVRKDYWSDGIGSIIMEELINFVKQCEATKTVTLSVNVENINAIKLYKKFGFDEIGIHKNKFNINGKFYDEMIMDLHLK